MMRAVLITTLLVWTLGSCAPVWAGPVVVWADEPAGAEVRKAAVSILEKIAAGDAMGARSAFAGDADQAELLEAHVKLARATRGLAEGAAARFGPDNQLTAVFGDMFRGRGEWVRNHLLILNGGSAAIAQGDLLDFGFRLRREAAGPWKVTHLTLGRGLAPAVTRQLGQMTEAVEAASAALVAGKFLNADEAWREATGAVGKAMSAGRTQHEPQANAPAMPLSAPISAEELRGLMGKSFDSPEVQELIGRLPAVPAISEFVIEGKRSIQVRSEEAGISFGFGGEQGVFGGLTVYLRPNDGFSAYSGSLPFGIPANAVRREVEARLGRPGRSTGGFGASSYHAQYWHLPLMIDYANSDGKDPQNPVAVLRTFRPPQGGLPAPTTQPVRAPRPRLEFRLVPGPEDVGKAATAFEMLPDPDDPGGEKQMVVLREVVLDLNNIATVEPRWDFKDIDPKSPPKPMGIAFELTPAGAERLERLSTAHEGRRMAVVFNGRVVTAPAMSGRMQKLIHVGVRPDLDVGDLCGQLNAAVNWLPLNVFETSPDR